MKKKTGSKKSCVYSGLVTIDIYSIEVTVKTQDLQQKEKATLILPVVSKITEFFQTNAFTQSVLIRNSAKSH